MGDILQLKLEDFIPSYAHFNEEFRDDSLFDVYEDEPENVFYRKKEFYKNRLGPTEDRPLGPGIPLKTQHNISRLLSPHTLNDEMLLFHGLGSGKCVHPSTTIKVEDGVLSIEEIWRRYNYNEVYDGEGYWYIPLKELQVDCISDDGRMVKRSIVKFYRQYIEEDLYTIILNSGKKITTTGRHKLLSTKWTMASMLSVGDETTVYDNDTIYMEKIKSIDKYLYEGYVYDLEVDEYHNYVAQTIVTHNTCSAVTISELSRSINPYLKPTLVLVKGGPIKRNFIRELATKCTKGKYIPDNYESLTKGEKVIRMNKLVSGSYDIHTFETFAKNVIDKGSDSYLTREYSDRVIIIDEAHNIRIQPKKKKKDRDTVDVYSSFHRFLHLLKNRKICLLTATPMRDRPEEFASIMNLILPLDEQLPTGKEFVDTFFKAGKITNKQKLKDKIRGRVSYVRSMESGIVKNFKGRVIRDMKKIRVYDSTMSEFQTSGYIRAYNTDTGEDNVNIEEIGEDDEEKKTQGLYDKSRQASLFVFPDGSYGSEGFNTYVKQVGSSYVLIQSFKDELTNYGRATVNEIIDNIRKYSSIYAETIDEIIKHPDENTFVYNKYVQGSGAILFGLLLNLVGFERTRGHIDMDKDIDKNREEINELNEGVNEEKYEKDEKEDGIVRRTPRFAIITGETVSEVEVDRIVDGIFNDPRNKHSRYIQVIIGSQIIGEGKSLRNVRQIHIQTPHWNNSETEQAMGRGIRAFSHEDLPLQERFVKVFRHASVPLKGIESINYIMYKISEDKDFQIKQVERVCKEKAVDCGLNKGRNRLSSDIDYSRECDYMKCDYTCDYDEEDLPSEELISDTYNLFYAESEIESITGIIKQLFRKKFSYDLTELMEEFRDISSMVIIRALKKIIDKSIQLVNRYGFPCFLREDHNLYFLVDEVTLPSSFMLARYTQYPNVKPYYKFEDTIRLLQYRYIEDKIFVLENLDPNDQDDKKSILEQVDSLSPTIKEMFLEMAIVGESSGTSHPLRKLIIEHFRNYITKLPDKTVSTLLFDYEEKLRCISKTSMDYRDWHDCQDTVEEEIEDVKVEEKVNLELNPYGYYGIMAKKARGDRFKIMEVKASNKDARKNPRGIVCVSIIPKNRINDYIDDINNDELNIVPPINVAMKDRDVFIKDIYKHTKKFTIRELEKMSDDRIKALYYWYVKASKKDMCGALQRWFESKDLMYYEK